MKRYGYKRMTKRLAEHFAKCVQFYHLKPFVKDHVECCILRHPAAAVAVCNGHRAAAERPGCGDRTAA